MNTNQRMRSIRLADKIKLQPEYAKTIGVSVIFSERIREGEFNHEGSCRNRCGDVQDSNKK